MFSTSGLSERVSIHAPLARSNIVRGVWSSNRSVSIHAPLARSNTETTFSLSRTKFQYMLLLRGATCRFNGRECTFSTFQYMLLLRGATGNEQHPGPHRRGRLNTCSSCEEQLGRCRSPLQETVSIHAPLARSNAVSGAVLLWSVFQYMLLLRGATRRSGDGNRERIVSIHAPLARSNNKLPYLLTGQWFQYMLLLRGATVTACHRVRRVGVSIHAPLARSN